MNYIHINFSSISIKVPGECLIFPGTPAVDGGLEKPDNVIHAWRVRCIILFYF